MFISVSLHNLWWRGQYTRVFLLLSPALLTVAQTGQLLLSSYCCVPTSDYGSKGHNCVLFALFCLLVFRKLKIWSLSNRTKKRAWLTWSVNNEQRSVDPGKQKNKTTLIWMFLVFFFVKCWHILTCIRCSHMIIFSGWQLTVTDVMCKCKSTRLSICPDDTMEKEPKVQVYK